MNQPFAFIDLLGFKNIAKTQSLEDLHKCYARFLHRVNAIIHRNEKYPRYATMFDTMVIWPRNPDDTGIQLSFHYFFHFLMRVLYDSIVNISKEDIAIRGGISFGDYEAAYFINAFGIENLDTFFIGQPEIDAYLWESEQKWLGISFEPTNVKEIEKNCPELLKYLKDNNYLVEYDIPTVQGNKKSLVINFICKNQYDLLHEAIILEEKRNAGKQFSVKYTATKLFTEFIKENNKFIPTMEFVPFGM